MEEKIKNIFKKNKIEISDIQAKQFREYYSFLVQENGKYNLTAITSFEDVVEKHFVDSAYPYLSLKQNAKLIDVGTGAGFPGIPLKILRPDLDITLIDSLNKRINFLNQTISLLNLKNIKAFHSRAEDFAAKNRESFDYAVSRAVAATPTLSEYLIPFVKIGGYALFYKSQNIEEELNSGKKAIQILGGNIEKIDNFSISDNKRSIIFIKKIKSTPNIYPRGKNLPKTKPILWKSNQKFKDVWNLWQTSFLFF